MRTMKGPGIFLSQFIGAEAPFNSLDGLAEWAAGKGYKAVQIPCNHPHIFDVEKAAESQTYCDDIAAKLAAHGLVISELSTHLEGQLVAVNPIYSDAFDHFAPTSVRGNDAARRAWATEKLKQAAVASARLGLKAHATFSGSLAWPFFYPWPPHNEQRFQAAFLELATRWRPILDAFDEQGVNVCFELHPGEDLHDGVTFERFLALVDNHPRCNILYDPSHMLLQQMDYLAFIDIFHARIKAFHVKDAEFRPSGRSGVYGGYQPWLNRAGRFRSLGDGQIDFKGIFGKLTGGLGSLYGITSYLSDVLSYSRLLALGLATGVVAQVFNTLGSLAGGGIAGSVLLIVVFAFGTVFNIAINALGAFVHSCRLQYVEFFGKFYTGGGRPFAPFERKTKYIKILKEGNDNVK